MIGFPKIEGSDSINELDQSIKTFSQVPSTAGGTFSNIANTYSSSEVSYIIGGSNFSGNIGKTFWLGGAFYENYRYKFTRNTTIETGLINANGSLVGDTLLSIVNYDSTGLEHRDQWVHYFLSFVPNFSNNFFLCLEYNGGFGWHHMPVFLAKIDSSFFMRYHNFRVGVEMVFSNIGWFDILCARGGMQAHWGQIYTERIIPFNSWFWSTDFSKNGGKFTGGFGLTKKRITFDISFDFIKWLIDQDETLKMAEILATLTFDFHSKKEY